MSEHISNEQLKNAEQVFSSEPQMAEVEITSAEEALNDHNAFKKSYSWLDVVVMIAVFLLSQAMGGALAILIGVRYPDEVMLNSFDVDVQEQVSFMQARFVAVGYLISMVICLVFLWWYKHVRRLPLEMKFRMLGWASPFRLLCGYLLLWVFTVALEPLTAILPGDQSSMGSGGWLLVSAVVLAPVFEEVLFRGYIAGTLRYAYGAVAAWVISALLFAVVHAIPSVMVAALFSGLVLSFYYLRYRSLVMVILLHAMNNATACFLQTIDMSDVTLHQLLGGGKLYWSIYACALVIALVALLRMFKLLRMAKK